MQVRCAPAASTILGQRLTSSAACLNPASHLWEFNNMRGDDRVISKSLFLLTASDSVTVPYWNVLGFSQDKSQQKKQRLMVTKPVKRNTGQIVQRWPESRAVPINMWQVEWCTRDFWSSLSPSCSVQELVPSPGQSLAPGVSVIKACLREELLA